MPRAAVKPKKPSFRTSKPALAALRAGDLETSLPALAAFAANGANEASAALAMVAAYRREWPAAVAHVAAAFRSEGTIYAGNVWDDLATVLVRAARETGSFEGAVAAVPETAKDANALRTVERIRKRIVAERDGTVAAPIVPVDAAAQFAAAAVRLDADPKLAAAGAGEKARRHFKVAVACRALDDAERIYRARPSAIYFDDLVAIAPRLVATDPEAAWAALAERIFSWLNVDHAQVAPAVLLTDPFHALLTPARAALVLATPRGTEAWRLAYDAGTIDG